MRTEQNKKFKKRSHISKLFRLSMKEARIPSDDIFKTSLLGFATSTPQALIVFTKYLPRGLHKRRDYAMELQFKLKKVFLICYKTFLPRTKFSSIYKRVFISLVSQNEA